MRIQGSNFVLPLRAMLLQLLLAYASFCTGMLENKNEEEETQVIFMAPLGRGGGTLTVDLWFGNPVAQKQTMILDTGSSIAAIPCEQCHDCGSRQHTLYQNSQSRFFHTIQGCDNCQLGDCVDVYQDEGYLRGSHHTVKQCQIEQHYVEASGWEATEVSDVVSLRPPISEHSDYASSRATFPLNFGCQNYLEGLFLSQSEDGILGMSFSESSYWYQMYSKGVIHHKKFSLCIPNKDTDDEDNANHSRSGIITLGGSDERIHQKPMVFAECFTDDEQWFAVNIENIFLRNNNKKTSDVKLYFDKDASRRIYLDSGSTDTYFPKCLATPFKKAFQKIAGMKYKDEGLTRDEISLLPSIIIQLTRANIVSQEELSLIAQNKKRKITSRAQGTPKSKKISIEITPSQYLSPVGDGTYEIGIDFIMDDSQGGLLGAGFMSDFDILFDMDSSRIGFADSKCDYEYHQSSYSAKEQ